MRILRFVGERVDLTTLTQPQTIQLLLEDGSYPLTEDDTYTLDGDDFPGYRFLFHAPMRTMDFVSRRDQLAAYQAEMGIGALCTEASERLTTEAGDHIVCLGAAWQLRFTAR